VKKQSGQLVRQNSATDSQPTVSAGQDWSIRVNSVQREVQQQGRTTARMHDRRHRWLPAEVDRSWDAPVVRIEMVRPRWPLSGRQTTLNAASYCAPVSSISAGQQRNGQVADRRDTVYGSEGWGFESLRARPAQRPVANPAAGFLAALGATPGATRTCQPRNSARLIDSAAARLSPSSRCPYTSLVMAMLA